MIQHILETMLISCRKELKTISQPAWKLFIFLRISIWIEWRLLAASFWYTYPTRQCHNRMTILFYNIQRPRSNWNKLLAKRIKTFQRCWIFLDKQLFSKFINRIINTLVHLISLIVYWSIHFYFRQISGVNINVGSAYTNNNNNGNNISDRMLNKMT